MKLFKDNKFYVVVDKGGDFPTFVTFGSSGGFRKCESIVEASKFKELASAKNAASNEKNLSVFMVEINLHTEESGTVWETWSWKEAEK